MRHLQRIALGLSVLLDGGVGGNDVVAVLRPLEDEGFPLCPLEVLAGITPEDGFVVFE